MFNLGDRKGHVSGANTGLLVLRNEMWRETELFFVCCAPFGLGSIALMLLVFMRFVCLCPFGLDQMGWIIVVMWGLGFRVELGFRIAVILLKRVKDVNRLCEESGVGMSNPDLTQPVWRGRFDWI